MFLEFSSSLSYCQKGEKCPANKSKTGPTVGYRKESSGERIEFISVLSKIIQEREATVGRSHGQETR